MSLFLGCLTGWRRQDGGAGLSGSAIHARQVEKARRDSEDFIPPARRGRIWAGLQWADGRWPVRQGAGHEYELH